MDRIEHEAAAGREDLAAPQHLLAHLRRRAERQRLLGVDAAAPEHQAVAVLRLQLAGSIPAAEHCTGLTMSKPASMNDSKNRSTEPHECLKTFQVVFAWIQSQIRV